MAALDEATLVRLLRGASFPEPKARDLIALSKRIVEEHGGVVPDTMEGLVAFRGVGPKIAALTLAVGFGRAAIAVDIHVHRVANRWGYVATSTPEQTMAALAAKLPERYWVEINERLVPFGKPICTGVRPQMLDLPLALDVPAGRGDVAPLTCIPTDHPALIAQSAGTSWPGMMPNTMLMRNAMRTMMTGPKRIKRMAPFITERRREPGSGRVLPRRRRGRRPWGSTTTGRGARAASSTRLSGTWSFIPPVATV